LSALVSHLSLFFYVFGVIFMAELPDKTALAALVLATQNKPTPVFLGTALALAVQSAVAVLAGRLFALLPPRPVHVVSGIVFIVSAVIMFRSPPEEPDAELGEAPKKPRSFVRIAAMAFGVIFLAEWGDLTQLGTAALAARYAAPVLIFTASTLALCAAAGVAVVVGHRAAKVLNRVLLQRIAGGLFALVGVALVLNLV
jgi:putative Ca2+/H+ antiporter (TMEM165/GDT1 family)